MAKASWAFPFNSVALAQNYVDKAMTLFQDLPEGKVEKVRGGFRMSSSIWRVPFDVSIVSVDRRYVNYMLVKYDHKEYVETRRFSKWLNAVNFVHTFADELEYEIGEDEDSYGEWDLIDKESDEDIRFKLFILVYEDQANGKRLVEGYYDLLGVKQTDSDEVVKKAFRKKVMESHPDHGGNEKEFIEIQEAYAGIVADRQNGAGCANMTIKSVYAVIDFKLLITNIANEWLKSRMSSGNSLARTICWLAFYWLLCSALWFF